MSNFTDTPNDSRQFAYQAAGRITKSRMAQESPLDAAALEAVEASDIGAVALGLGVPAGAGLAADLGDS
jgi:hypothetical protein